MSDENKVERVETVPVTEEARIEAALDEALQEKALTLKEKLSYLNEEIERAHALVISIHDNTRETFYSEQKRYEKLVDRKIELIGLEQIA